MLHVAIALSCVWLFEFETAALGEVHAARVTSVRKTHRHFHGVPPSPNTLGVLVLFHLVPVARQVFEQLGPFSVNPIVCCFAAAEIDTGAPLQLVLCEVAVQPLRDSASLASRDPDRPTGGRDGLHENLVYYVIKLLALAVISSRWTHAAGNGCWTRLW